MGDLRVPMDSALAAFGVAAVVTRPSPDDDPVATTGIWLPAADEEQPFGMDLKRRDPRRVFGLARTTSLTHVPKGSIVVAPDEETGAARSWRVDGYARPVEADEMRVMLMPVTGS